MALCCWPSSLIECDLFKALHLLSRFFFRTYVYFTHYSCHCVYLSLVLYRRASFSPFAAYVRRPLVSRVAAMPWTWDVFRGHNIWATISMLCVLSLCRRPPSSGTRNPVIMKIGAHILRLAPELRMESRKTSSPATFFFFFSDLLMSINKWRVSALLLSDLQRVHYYWN